MKDHKQVEVAGDADAVTSEIYGENTIKNLTWYTAEDNHVSLVSENVEKTIKLETDMLDDWIYFSMLEIIKDDDNESNMKLPLECQDVADNNIYLNDKNTSDKIFHCNICGKSFELNYLLKNHLAEHKSQINHKTNKCTFCGKKFKLKIGLNTHIQKYHNSVNGDHFPQQINIQKSSVLRQQSVVPTASQISMANNINILNIKQEKNLCTNVREVNSSDQVDSVNSNKSTLENKPHDLMAEQNPINIANNNTVSTVIINHKTNKCTFCGKKFKLKIGLNKHIQKYHNSVNGDHFPQQINIQKSSVLRQQSVVPTASQISMANNFNILNIKQEKNLCRNVREINSSDQVDSVNSNESTLENKPHDLMAEQNPINIANNNTVSTDRESPYFYISKLYDIKNGFRIDDYDQTSQNNAIFMCRICRKIPSTNIHAFALHMSSHSECNMHECIVCDITFKSVALWVNHMMYHEQEISDQVDSVNSNESTLENKPHDLMAEQNPINIANNNTVSTDRESPYFYISKLYDIKNGFRIDDYDQTSQNNAIFMCRICRKIPSTNIHAFALHMSSHSECNMHECIVCDITFKSVALWVNHMMYHEQEISDQVDSVNSNESTLENKPHDLMAEQNPINIANNNTVSTDRESPYFYISKLYDIKNGFRIDDYDQTSQNNAIFMCRICRKIPSTNIHAFALHMSSHSECNMHECIVCDKTFNTVALWANHMIHHQQEID